MEVIKGDKDNVLILVLMDNQNTNSSGQALKTFFVLILVLMDNQNTITELRNVNTLRCLNPCSNG